MLLVLAQTANSEGAAAEPPTSQEAQKEQQEVKKSTQKAPAKTAGGKSGELLYTLCWLLYMTHCVSVDLRRGRAAREEKQELKEGACKDCRWEIR